MQLKRWTKLCSVRGALPGRRPSSQAFDFVVESTRRVTPAGEKRTRKTARKWWNPRGLDKTRSVLWSYHFRAPSVPPSHEALGT
jgi:hypothetical protein